MRDETEPSSDIQEEERLPVTLFPTELPAVAAPRICQLGTEYWYDLALIASPRMRASSLLRPGGYAANALVL